MIVYIVQKLCIFIVVKGLSKVKLSIFIAVNV